MNRPLRVPTVSSTSVIPATSLDIVVSVTGQSAPSH
jgi:hypothetical protein